MSDPVSPYSFRRALPEDAKILAHHRIGMFRDMGLVSGEEAEQLFHASIGWFERLVSQQEYIGWFALHEGEAVAGGGILLRELGPVPGSPYIGRWGYIINVYTEPEYRRHGLARSILQLILDWAEVEKLDRVTLTASNEGKPLYESLGFNAINEMKLGVRDRA